MKNKWLILALLLIALALAACAPAKVAGVEKSAASAGAADNLSDPFAYCAAVGQIDAPDARYTGAKMPDALFKAYIKAAGLDASADFPDTFKQMTIWRCMDHKVYACNFGANIPCDSKANSDKTPTQAMIDYCKASPGSDFIPMAVTGHNVIYSWRCIKDTPEVLDQIDTVDAAGYQSRNWQLLEPAP